MASLLIPKQILLAHESQLTLLKNLDVMNTHLSTKVTGDMANQDKENNSSIIMNREDPGNVNNEVPGADITTGEEREVCIQLSEL